MVNAAKFFNEWYPKPAIVLKFLELVGIDGVTQITCDHDYLFEG